jgi:RNA ligase
MSLPFTIEELDAAVADGLVTKRPHVNGKLSIYNYSPLVQYSRNWTPVTKTCRGLVLDEDYNIVARPFPKIFNYTEIIPDPVIYDRVPNVSDKADGSLGIIYHDGNDWSVATRGSFESDQAIWATNWLQEEYPALYSDRWAYSQPEGVTTLVEIIYPDNRICVDYGDKAELVLIAAIDNNNGADIPLQALDYWHGTRIDEYTGFDTIDDAYRFATSNEYEGREGVVCTWFKYGEPSFRLKVKHPEYVRLHGIIHSFSVKKVWESLSSGEDFLELLAEVPDEFYQVVKQTVGDLNDSFSEIEHEVIVEFGKVKHLTSKKDFALAIKSNPFKSILFRMYDNKDFDDIIWKMIKPRSE